MELNLLTDLLIDYLEEESAALTALREKVQKLEHEFIKTSDPDLRREVVEIKKEIRNHTLAIKDRLLINFEEFCCIHKYFPEFLSVLVEDEVIGPIIAKKLWLLERVNLDPKQAADTIKQLHLLRQAIRWSRRYLHGKYGKYRKLDFHIVEERVPFLRGKLSENMGPDEINTALDNVDGFIKREGWRLLICDALIEIPINKFLAMFHKYSLAEAEAMSELKKARGSRMDYEARRKIDLAKRKKERYANFIRQLLLVNPHFLTSLKRKSDWLSRNRKTSLQKLASNISPAHVKEQIWLKEMRKRLGA